MDSYVQVLHYFAKDIKQIEESVDDDLAVFKVNTIWEFQYRVLCYQENWMLSVIA